MFGIQFIPCIPPRNIHASINIYENEIVGTTDEQRASFVCQPLLRSSFPSQSSSCSRYYSMEDLPKSVEVKLDVNTEMCERSFAARKGQFLNNILHFEFC